MNTFLNHPLVKTYKKLCRLERTPAINLNELNKLMKEIRNTYLKYPNHKHTQRLLSKAITVLGTDSFLYQIDPESKIA